MRTRLYSTYGATLVSLLGAGAALACPVASDLEAGGIRFTTTDGSAEIQRRLDEHRIEVDFVIPNDPIVSRSITIHGTYLAWYGTILENGALERGSAGWVTRPMDLAEIPEPVAGEAWSTMQTFFDDAGGKVEERLIASIGARTTWNLGACSYEAVPVSITISTEDDTYTEQVMYIPALRTGVLTGYSDSSGSGSYDYVDIAVEPVR
ncbi:hypothetical protein V8J82_00595 [Gymnodinialimonas sp. 2305UL16-5]|uniref:hypothetical protein n=1 Tax=Gymnodinialimonas mytili TaxID=3126503 RepID=UPI0030A9DB67